MSAKTIASVGAIAVLLTAISFVGVSTTQALTSDECFARFTGLDGNKDKQLSSSEAGDHIKGDANSDGAVSNDEFMKACEKGIFDAMPY